MCCGFRDGSLGLFLFYVVRIAYDTQEAEWLELRLHGSMH